MMALWPSGSSAEEIFLSFPIQSPGVSVACPPLLTPPMTVSIQLPWKVDTYSGCNRACVRRRQAKGSRPARQRNTHLPYNNFHLDSVWKQFGAAFVPVRSHYPQMKFTKYQFNFNNGDLWPYTQGWGEVGGIDHIITSEGPLVASKYFPVRGNQNQSGSC